MAWSPESVPPMWEQSRSPLLDNEIVKDHLYSVNVHKSMESGGIYYRVLVELRMFWHDPS